MRFFRPTLRVRMALLYGGLVLLVGISLLFTCVILIERSIDQLPTLNGHPAKAQEAKDRAVSYLLHTGLLYFGIIVVIGTTWKGRKERKEGG